MRKDDMVVGKNFITDKVVANVTLENGRKTTINWYQFKVPIKDYEKVIGAIQDFKSIRFMRLFMKGFEQTTILRFAKLELKRGEWRKYDEGLVQGSEGTAIGDEAGTLDISAVNIEENSSKEPVNYVLPPGIDRVIDPTNPQLRQLNEQSMILKVEDLSDGDARAAFKNTDLDLRQYRRLRMAIHAEALKGQTLADNDLTVFIRLGTDYKNNYYEYEVPLKITPPGKYKDTDGDRKTVWPGENSMIIDLEELARVKLARNAAMEAEGSQVSLTTRFPQTLEIEVDGKTYYRKVYVVGNPNLGSVRTIMIGVRNPGNNSNEYPNDGLSKSGEVWVNELRLTNFNDNGGWAANARASVKLADLGTVSLAGATSTPGFGSIEKKVMQRSTEEINSYDLSSNLELGKFFPSKASITIPMFVSISETFVNPQYSPLDPDILFDEALKSYDGSRARKRFKNQAQDYSMRKSLNFTNIRFGKAKGKPKPWDLSNWTMSYAYSEELNHDIRTEQDLQRRQFASLGYTYTIRPPNVAPFKKVAFLKAPAFAIIRDFNFNYLPSTFSFRTDLNREYQFTKMRELGNDENIELKVEPTIYKEFFWNRYYDLKYDLTRSIKLDFSATNMARIDEPLGELETNRVEMRDWADSLRNFANNLIQNQRTVDYHHTVNANYTLPLNKIPILSWTSHSIRYSGTYSWIAGPRTADTTINLGNTITNSSKIDLTGQYNFNNLYNKVGFLKKLNEKPGKPNDPKKPKEYKTVTFEKFFATMRAGVPRSVYHQLNSDKVKIKVIDANNREIPVTTDVPNMNKITVTPDSALRNVTVVVEAQVERKENPLLIFIRGLGKAAIGVKNISFTYSIAGGTKLPGYIRKTKWGGLDFSDVKSLDDLDKLAPGLPFIVGIQDQAFGRYAARQGWLTTDSMLSAPYLFTHMESINLRGTLEPLPGMKIDLTANRQKATNSSVYYFYQNETYNFSDGQMITGNFNMSVISWKTAFDKMKMESPYSSATFDQFRKNAAIISDLQFHQRYPYDLSSDSLMNGYYAGYSMTSQEVLIPAFFAAYTGRSAREVELGAFPSWKSMRPNWRISYDGLSNIPFLQRYFRSINLNHSYKSSYSVGTYSNNIDFSSGGRDGQGNYIPEFDIGSITINEQFSPLIGLDVTWQTDMTTRLDLKKTRTATLSLANNQVIEMTTSEVTIGAGYRFDDVQFTLTNAGGTQKNLKSDLNIKADLSIRDNRTILRQLVEENNQPSAGQRAVSIKLSADYMLGPNFNLRLFFDRMVNKPYVSTSFPTYNTNIGFSLTFSLTQQAAAGGN
jgi:cell surface protein SprA